MNKKSLWQILSLSAILGVIFYIIHVILGGILWKGYNHMTQTISELTGENAPDAAFLSKLTFAYGILLVIFSISLLMIFLQKKVHKLAILGSILLIVMEITSLIGYSLFPLNTELDMSSFQNMMHMVVTAVVVICTIGFGFFIGIGLLKTKGLKRIGIFVLVCAIIITVAGSLTPITMVNNIPIAGLFERINIFTLHICTIGLSISSFHGLKISNS